MFSTYNRDFKWPKFFPQQCQHQCLGTHNYYNPFYVSSGTGLNYNLNNCNKYICMKNNYNNICYNNNNKGRITVPLKQIDSSYLTTYQRDFCHIGVSVNYKKYKNEFKTNKCNGINLNCGNKNNCQMLPKIRYDPKCNIVNETKKLATYHHPTLNANYCNQHNKIAKLKPIDAKISKKIKEQKSEKQSVLKKFVAKESTRKCKRKIAGASMDKENFILNPSIDKTVKCLYKNEKYLTNLDTSERELFDFHSYIRKCKQI